MKAISYHRYGGPEVLQYGDVPDPVAKDGEILVRVRAASLNPRDWHLMRGLPYLMRLQFGVRQLKYTGFGGDIAGEVVSVGHGVTRFKPGDEVYAEVLTGALAEYICVPENLLALKPANLSFEESAAVPLAAVTALQGLRDAAKLQPGQKLLIIGAGGGVGTFAVQLGKWMGAHVTGVCSTSKIDLVRSLGADDVIDYTQDDFTRGGRSYDVVLQLAGMQSPNVCRKALTPHGILLVSSGESDGRWLGPLDRIIYTVLLDRFVSQKLTPFEAKPSIADLSILKDLIEAGTVRPVLDRTYPMTEAAEAMRYLEEGHARGKIVITV